MLQPQIQSLSILVWRLSGRMRNVRLHVQRHSDALVCQSVRVGVRVRACGCRSLSFQQNEVKCVRVPWR